MRVVPTDVHSAAQMLCRGKIGIVPTETVYGIACDALVEKSVRRVFEIKQRPAENPMIVHIANRANLDALAEQISEEAERCIRAFWPGPLTLVLRKSRAVPDVTTAGLPTIAIRCPEHPVIQQLLETSGLALAAPSANLFSKLSPTRIEHLDPAILRAVDFVLDGGPCRIGIESTVVDTTTEPFTLLRPGAITESEFAEIGVAVSQNAEVPRRSPGLYSRHYSPQTRMILSSDSIGERPGLVFDRTAGRLQISMPSDPADYRAALYDALFRMDQLGLECFWVEAPPEEPQWKAVRDRLSRAAG